MHHESLKNTHGKVSKPEERLARKAGIRGLWHSLSGRLFTLVFGGYLCLVILVTVVQLTLEYRYITGNIRHDLANLGQSFQESASEAMWTMDHKLLGSMAMGWISRVM